MWFARVSSSRSSSSRLCAISTPCRRRCSCTFCRFRYTVQWFSSGHELSLYTPGNRCTASMQRRTILSRQSPSVPDGDVVDDDAMAVNGGWDVRSMMGNVTTGISGELKEKPSPMGDENDLDGDVGGTGTWRAGPRPVLLLFMLPRDSVGDPDGICSVAIFSPALALVDEGGLLQSPLMAALASCMGENEANELPSSRSISSTSTCASLSS